MARAAGLLDRLAGEDEGVSLASLAFGQVSADDYIASIKANIARVLNDRRGNCLSAPRFGLTDFNDGAFESDNMAAYIRQDIRDCILAFEPRVTRITVQPVPREETPLDMRFQLHLQVVHRPGDDPLQFEVQLGNGAVKVI